jgi:hypothetical protein
VSINLQEALLRGDERRRPLDWRFRRAIAMSQAPMTRRNPRRSDDKLVCLYADLLYRLNNHTTYIEMEKIRKKYPDLFRVHITYATLNATELALTDAMLLSVSVDPAVVEKQTGMNAAQQNKYRQMFLDIEDRREMSSFIAMQIMEPSRLRSSASELSEQDNPEALPMSRSSDVRGTFSDRALRVLRLIGFYSSPVVVEMMYSGLIADSVPSGRDSAVRYMTQACLTSVRRRGLMSTYLDNYSDRGIERFMKLAFTLAVEERSEGQVDILQNIETLFQGYRQRIGSPSKILEVDCIPKEAVAGRFELSESEMVEASRTGKLPAEIAKLTQDIEKPFTDSPC